MSQALMVHNVTPSWLFNGPLQYSGTTAAARHNKQEKACLVLLRPVMQIEPGSYLRRAFENLIGGGDPGDFSSSSDTKSSDGQHR